MCKVQNFIIAVCRTFSTPALILARQKTVTFIQTFAALTGTARKTMFVAVSKVQGFITAIVLKVLLWKYWLSLPFNTIYKASDFFFHLLVTFSLLRPVVLLSTIFQ
jgi:hypothetical protein